MGQEIKPGSRWKSAVCSTEVIVVKAPADAVTLECGGHPMVAAGQSNSDIIVDPAHGQGGH